MRQTGQEELTEGQAEREGGHLVMDGTAGEPQRILVALQAGTDPVTGLQHDQVGLPAGRASTQAGNSSTTAAAATWR